MPGFKLKKLKGELFEILGLEQYIESKMTKLMSAFGGQRKRTPEVPLVTRSSPAATPVTKARKGAAPPTTKRGTVRAKKQAPGGKDALITLLEQHPRRNELVQAGSQKDQLLRSLIPLYVAKDEKLELNSGEISRFWGEQGLNYAASNAAKAFRLHIGYAKGGKITPNGVKYVEAALKKTQAA